MIDYDKLKLAHEMCLGTNYLFQIEFGWEDGMDIELVKSHGSHFEVLNRMRFLDDLIAKLQELMQPKEPKAKYKVGDDLWWLAGYLTTLNKPNIVSGRIQSIFWDEQENNYIYVCDLYAVCEEMLYPTKQALIEAQIKYWQSLHSLFQPIPMAND